MFCRKTCHFDLIKLNTGEKVPYHSADWQSCKIIKPVHIQGCPLVISINTVEIQWPSSDGSFTMTGWNQHHGPCKSFYAYSTLDGWNYPWLEQFFMVSSLFKPLNFYCALKPVKKAHSQKDKKIGFQD